MHIRIITLSLLFFSFLNTPAQLINHYWMQNFNSTSSLIGGAVVAGDGDNSSIYYNPATIVEMELGSNVSIAANLFTWNIYNNYNALGDGNDLHNTNFQVQPQFMSFTHRPKKRNFSYAVSILTRIKEDFEASYAESQMFDLLPEFPGEEIYNTAFHYRNKYTDTWVGFGIGQELNKGFSYGATLFVSGASFVYNYAYSASAYKFVDSDSININPSRVSSTSYEESLRFSQYRIITKLGMAYKYKNWRFGLVFTLPSVNVFTTGRNASRGEKQVNIHDSTGYHIPDYTIFSVQKDGQLKANYKYPFAVAFGLIGTFKEGRQKLYYSMEYFHGIKPYEMMNAEINPNITSPSIYESLPNKDYLSYAFKADPVFNFVIGYSWDLRNNFKFVNAFRTDFSSIQSINSDELDGYNYIKTEDFNIYHYSAGLNFNFKKNNVTAGGEFSFGAKNNIQQAVNFEEPVEYDPDTGSALLGPRKNDSYIRYYGISVYISATLNFFNPQD